jgi:hypothetical protein
MCYHIIFIMFRTPQEDEEEEIIDDEIIEEPILEQVFEEPSSLDELDVSDDDDDKEEDYVNVPNSSKRTRTR